MTDCKNVNVCWNSEKSSKIGINYETIMLKVLRAMHLSEVCDMLMKIKKC
jgi:hypothetical protein